MGLTQKEQKFCRLYACLSNVEEAARKAGYSHPFQDGSAILQKEDAIQEIARFRQLLSHPFQEPSVHGESRAALQRMIFGPANDAARLVMEEDGLDLSALDLFSVTEIKKGKGAVEVKFIDRLEAVRLLCRLEEEEGRQQSAESFLGALCACGGSPSGPDAAGNKGARSGTAAASSKPTGKRTKKPAASQNSRGNTGPQL